MRDVSISIITPSFNQGLYLEKTIDSVLSQNYPKLEYIIIDGGSNDNSINIIKKYEKHLTYWVSELDSGQSEAINKGFKKATGDIINWINSDDYYEKDTFKTVAEAFVDPNTQVLCGRGNIINEAGEFIRHSRGTDVYEGNLHKTIGWARMDQPETFFRRSVLEKIGYLRQDLHYLMDRDLWIRFLFNYGLKGIKKIDDKLINFRLHSNSKTVSQLEQFQVDHDSFFYAMARQYSLNEQAAIIASFCEVHKIYQLEIPLSVDVKDIHFILNYYFLRRAEEFYASNERDKARSCLTQVNVHHLPATERKLYRKIAFRNTYVPKSVINLLRKR